MNGNAVKPPNESSKNKISLTGLSLPKGGGAIRGVGETFSPNPFSGTGSFSVPIPVTPCRNSEPQLSLSYNSGAGNGVFGPGFSVAIPNIARKTDKGIPKYDETDVFVFSDTEDLVPRLRKAPDGTWVPEREEVNLDGTLWNVTSYIPRIEGLFALIEHWQNLTGSYWKVITKENSCLVYGQSEQTRIADPLESTRIFKWFLEKAYDAKGNKVEYEYKTENQENVPQEIYELNRPLAVQKYIHRIKYGNYLDANMVEQWAFEVIFDYGEYCIEESYLKTAGYNPYVPTNAWKCRPDPFSSYRSGFELRTYRLCQNILIFHHLKEVGTDPCLVKALSFNYQEATEAVNITANQTAKMLTLTQIQVTGFRKNANSVYQCKSMPPLKLTYSMFNPCQQSFTKMQVEDARNGAGQINLTQYNFVDLYGDGIPGFLYSNDQVTLYWRATGEGMYGSPEPPVTFPLEKNLLGREYSLTSLEGNGKLDLVVGTAERGGFYRNTPEGSWESYRDFASYPFDYVNPAKDMTDLNGRGLSDLLIIQNRTATVYPSLKSAGFGTPFSVDLPKDFPVSNNRYSEEFVGFADIFGDGLSHRVRVRDGSLECWPNLGYGRFGEKILLGNAPHFGAALDASRLHLVDTDGSGAVDIVYVYADKIAVFLNQGGNSFSDPITIPLPEGYSESDQITFGDVHGKGSSCLILNKMGTAVEHYCLDFSGETKPYLLTQVDNCMGAVTRITYASSVHYYLLDERTGRPWKTRLPFPVQVVEKVEYIDQIAGSRMVTSYQYHDGYYDYQEKEFRGFGCVEQLDTEDINIFQENVEKNSDILEAITGELYVPPVRTKRWYHPGAPIFQDIVSRHSSDEYYEGDPEAYVLPDSTIESSILDENYENMREAYRALKGRLLREEVYAVDNEPVANHPYTVTEHNFHVLELQPAEDGRYGVYFAYDKESISYQYERNPADPRINHQFTLQVDAWGNVEKACQVFYPRRTQKNPSSMQAKASEQTFHEQSYPEQSYLAQIYPEQTRLQVTANVKRYAHCVDQAYVQGVQSEELSFEVSGLALDSKQYYSYSVIAEEVNQSLENIIRNDETPTPGQKQARLLTWQRNYYWNLAQSEALNLGEITGRVLLHHSEEAVLSTHLLEEIFKDKLTPEMVEADGGYYKDLDYWWNRAQVQYFHTDEDRLFHLPCKVENSFVLPGSPLHTKTEYQYDVYGLAPVQVRQYLTANICNTSSAIMDYQAMQTAHITDINGNSSEALFDPLGKVIATSVYGSIDGQIQGDKPLSEYQVIPDEEISFSDILQHPEQYLQGVTTYFYYDVQPWVRESQPVRCINLLRETSVSDLKEGQETRIQIHLSYCDGQGREIEKKIKADSGLAVLWETTGQPVLDDSGKVMEKEVEERWVVSGRTIFNNKAKPVKQYLPYFSSIAEYENQRNIEPVLPAPTIFHYDPLLRETRIDTPKGFFNKIEFTPWTETRYDEDDTIKDAEYYQEFLRTYPVNPTQWQKDEKDALEKAARFYQTPETKVLNNTGKVFLEVKDNLGEVTAELFTKLAEGTSISPAEFSQQLIDHEYLLNMGAAAGLRVSAHFQPYSAGFTLELDERFQQYADKLIELLKESCLSTYHVMDIKGNILLSIDPRLFYSNVKDKTDYFSIRYVRNMQDREIWVNSTDAGQKWELSNIYDKPIHTWDGRGFHTHSTYDSMQRLVSTSVEGDDGRGLELNQIVEQIVYGECISEDRAVAQSKNLLGNIYQHFDQAGIQTFLRYSIQSQELLVKRQLRAEYRLEVNWNDPQAVKLEDEVFSTAFTYDALGRMIAETLPDGSVQKNLFNQAGLLEKVYLTLLDQEQAIVEQIDYNAKGQRLGIHYGNGVATQYSYEESTLRLKSIMTTRPEGTKEPWNTTLQNLMYTYDAVGNVTRHRDNSFDTIYQGQQIVEPLSDYDYNPLYQLVSASGRQHQGLTENSRYNSSKIAFLNQAAANLNDGEKLEKYTEYYSYDPAGNLVQKKHCAASGSWTNVTEVAPDSNRAMRFTNREDNTLSPVAQYDQCGNLLALDNLRDMKWNYRNNLWRCDVIIRESGINDSDYYIYDAGGQRVRKITERYIGNGVTEIEEKIYLGSLEIKRIKKISSEKETLILDRQALRIKDDNRCVAISYHWLIDELKRETDVPGEVKLKYQLQNGLGSACIEVDQIANLITYEEYYPYGGTAIIAGANERDVAAKEYRFSGKERDTSTGLYYYGARYYPSWLGRWLNPDPAGTIDGLNLYAFVSGNPIKFTDETGNDGGSWLGLVFGGLTTLVVGLLGGAAIGTGEVAGPVVSALATTAGALVGGENAGSTLLMSAGLSMAASYIGGKVSRGLMRAEMNRDYGPTAVTATGLTTSSIISTSLALGGLYVGQTPSTLGLLTTGLGSLGGGVLASGSHFGSVHRGDAKLPTMPVQIQAGEFGKIQSVMGADNDVRDSNNVAHTRYYLELNPDETFIPVARHFKLTHEGNEVVCDLVVVHGYPGFSFPSTSDDYHQYIDKTDFANYLVARNLPKQENGHNVPIKFVSCFGGSLGMFSTAQAIADRLQTDVYAATESISVNYQGPWKKFSPQ